jgi:hypothetical protein
MVYWTKFAREGKAKSATTLYTYIVWQLGICLSDEQRTIYIIIKAIKTKIIFK